MSFFYDPQTERLRRGWQGVGFFVLAVLAATVGSTILTLGLGLLHLPFSAQTQGFAKLLVELTGSAIGVGAVTRFCFWYFPVPDFPAAGFARGPRWWLDLGGGFALGALMLSVTALGALLLGQVQLTFTHAAGSNLTLAGFQALLLFGVAGLFEELVCRGFLLQSFRLGIGPVASLILTSAFFALAHAGNPGVSRLALFNTFLAGVWLGIPVLKRKNLWAAWGLHAGWNAATVWLWGVPVSGYHDLISATVWSTQLGAPDWVTGGAYGPEGGVLCSVVLLLAILFLGFRVPGSGFRVSETGKEEVSNPNSKNFPAGF